LDVSLQCFRAAFRKSLNRSNMFRSINGQDELSLPASASGGKRSNATKGGESRDPGIIKMSKKAAHRKAAENKLKRMRKDDIHGKMGKRSRSSSTESLY
jgi:hypothetical protein